MNSSADNARIQGKLGEAEEMYLVALERKEKALGPDHPSTLNTVNNLGNLYSEQGKLGKALKMYQRALEGFEKALGPDYEACHRLRALLAGLPESTRLEGTHYNFLHQHK